MGVGRVCRGGMHRYRGRGGGVGIDQALRRGRGEPVVTGITPAVVAVVVGWVSAGLRPTPRID